MRTCSIPSVIAAFIHNYVSTQVRKELLQRSLLHTVTGVYEASLDVDRTCVQAHMFKHLCHACRKTKHSICNTKPHLLQTLVLAPSNPQSPKPHPPPNAGAHAHTHTDIYAHNHPPASTLPALNSCSLTINSPNNSN